MAPLTMSAGRELDARVLACFGWRWHRCCRDFRLRPGDGPKHLCAFLPPVPSYWDAKGVWQPAPSAEGYWTPVDGWPDKSEQFPEWWRWCRMLVNGIYRYEMPSPSTSISDAFDVLDKIPDPWTLERSSSGNYVVNFDGFVGIGETAPLAICRAVLKLKETHD